MYLAEVDDVFILNNYLDVLASEAHSSLEGLSTDEVKDYFEMKQRALLEHFQEKEEEKGVDSSVNPMSSFTS